MVNDDREAFRRLVVNAKGGRFHARPRRTSRRVRVHALAIPVHDCADLLQTALPGRTDAADRHVQLLGDGRVVAAAVEEEEDEQLPLALGQLGQCPVELVARDAGQRDLLRVLAAARPGVPGRRSGRSAAPRG
jgi:hypothetical protein